MQSHREEDEIWDGAEINPEQSESNPEQSESSRITGGCNAEAVVKQNCFDF